MVISNARGKMIQVLTLGISAVKRSTLAGEVCEFWSRLFSSLEIVQTIGRLRKAPRTEYGARSFTETADSLDDFETRLFI